MASSIQFLRSTSAQERPFPSNLLDGQPAVNLNSTEPGLFFKASDGSLFKIGPACITSDGSPPNSSPQGSSGNLIGELWLDKSLTPPILKIYDGSSWVNAGSGGGGPQANFIRWIYIASGGETVLSGSSGGIILEYTPGLEQVFVNGALLSRGSDYTATNGSNVSLAEALTGDDVVTVVSLNPASVISTPGSTSLLRWYVSASAGQTVLFGADTSGDLLAYTPGLETVYVNGVLLNRGQDYTAQNGTSITLAAPLNLNDEVAIVAFSDFNVGQSLASDVQFTPSDTESFTRTVQEKLRDTVSVKDFGAAGNGSADDTQAFIKALATGATVHVPPGIYKITQTLSFWNRNIAGLGDAESCIIEAHIPSATDPLFKTGRSSVISDLTLRYPLSLISGFESQGERVLITTFGGTFNFSLQRRSTVRNCRLGRCGTAIYSPESPVQGPAFSVTFDTLEVDNFSFRGFDFQATTRTGNVYSNIYLKSTYSNVDSCFYMTGEESECVIDQLNAEHTACSRAAIYLDGMRAMACNSIHIEGCDVTTPNNAYIEITRSSGSIESLSVYYTRMSQNNTSVLKLGSTNYNSLAAPNTLRYIRIGAFHMKGIARPDFGLYPSWPTNRKGLAPPSTVTGFNFISRPASFTDRIALQIDSYVWSTASTPNPDSSVYTAFPVDPNNNISFITKGSRGANFNGAQFAGPILMAGTDSNANAHPLLYDRNSNTYLPSFTWWFDDQTGLSHPAASEVGVTLANADKYRFKSGSFNPSFDNEVSLGLSSNRWTDTYSTKFRPGNGTATWTSGSGSPEGAITAAVGSLYTRTDGGVGTTLYVKESGAGNTGWVAK